MINALQVIDLITTDTSRSFAPAGRMASAIIDITTSKGECLPEDLSKSGFTVKEIEAHWHLAQSLASVELRLMGKD